MARRATAIAQYTRSAPGPVLVLDGGDSLYDAGDWPEAGEADAGALQVEAMNMMGYDALAVGAADLAPLPITQARISQARFAFLSANLAARDVLTGVQPHLLLEADGRTVAIIGVSNPAQLEQRLATLGLSIEVQDPLRAVQRSVEEVRDQTDVVVVLSNLDQENNEALARRVPGIDAIIGMKGWQTMPAAIQGDEGPVVLQGSGTLGEYLGLLTLYFDAQGRVVSFEGRGVALGPDFGMDPAMVQLMQDYPEGNP